MNEKTRSTALFVIVAAGLAALMYIWSAYGSTPAPQANQKEATASSAIFDGTVVAEKNADLGFVIPAKISSIAKKVGDSVKVGDILAMQENADIKAQLDSAKAGASSANFMLNQASHTLKKERIIRKDLSGNKRKAQDEQISNAEDDINIQKNALLSAQDAVKNVEAQLSKTILRAPFDGMITRQDSEVGEISSASTPPFLTIQNDLNIGKIEVFATELDVKQISVGQAASMAFDSLGSGEMFSASVVSIDPTAKLQNGNATYKVTLILDKFDDRIKTGMHANVSFR